jgi:hypothetical protein
VVVSAADSHRNKRLSDGCVAQSSDSELEPSGLPRRDGAVGYVRRGRCEHRGSQLSFDRNRYSRDDGARCIEGHYSQHIWIERISGSHANLGLQRSQLHNVYRMSRRTHIGEIGQRKHPVP